MTIMRSVQIRNFDHVPRKSDDKTQSCSIGSMFEAFWQEICFHQGQSFHSGPSSVYRASPELATFNVRNVYPSQTSVVNEPMGARYLMQKHSLTIKNHRTSISLEAPFFTALSDVAKVLGKTVPELVGEIDAERKNQGLSSAIRIYLLDYYRKNSEIVRKDGLSRSKGE